jgi:hypothetical protein
MRIGRILACAVMFCVLAIAGIAIAQEDPPGIPPWAAIVHQLAFKAPRAARSGNRPTGVFAAIIPQYLRSFDRRGAVETYHLAKPTDTSLSPGFNNVVFRLFDAWQNLADSDSEEDEDAARASIARGTLFNTKNLTISEVNGLNLEPVGQTSITSNCTTCHSPNIGNHSEKPAINIGVADAPTPVLDITGLPTFTVECTDISGPLQGQVFNVTDLGRALVTGKCADVGKVKGPILHGLAARAPYFHNG